jgi:hypothetical protein
MKRLTRELRDLAGKAALPCDPAASIFLRHDADNLDKMRAILTGESYLVHYILSELKL